MLNKRYSVVFLGLIGTREEFKHKMARLGVSIETSEMILNKAPVALKGDMTLGEARHYADLIQDAGGKVKLKEEGFFEERDRNEGISRIKPLGQSVRCPRCGQIQLRHGTCIRCGSELPKMNH